MLLQIDLTKVNSIGQIENLRQFLNKNKIIPYTEIIDKKVI